MTCELSEQMPGILTAAVVDLEHIVERLSVYVEESDVDLDAWLPANVPLAVYVVKVVMREVGRGEHGAPKH